MKVREIALVGLMALVGFVATAKTDSHFTNSQGADIAYNSKGTVVRGEWTSQFSKAWKQASDEKVPILLFWANNGCGHCAATEVELCKTVFTKWQKQMQLYMVFGMGTYDGPAGNEQAAIKEKAKHNSGEYPYVAVYWKGKKVANFTGNGVSAETFIADVEAGIKGYTPAVGGTFVGSKAEATEGNRYEAEATSKTVTLRLERPSSNKSAGTDAVKVSFDGKSKSYTVNWAKNAATATVDVEVPAGMKAGDKAKAVINGESKDTCVTYIYFVEKENASANPKWVGESFDYGEWTADIDAAKAKVAAASGSAYTLISIQGSMWCPDCANTDRNFLDLVDGSGNNRFKAWAKSKNVALVTMDVPNYTGPKVENRATPTLFSTAAFETTLARAREYPAAGAKASLTNALKRSGLGYMTRKGISDADAKATLEKFHDLAVNSIEDGGFHVYFGADDARNEDGNANRTGVPIFVLLRKDGTVAARLTRLASVSPMKADQANFDNYIKRFEEMLEIADGDASEIANNYPGAGAIPLTPGGSAKGRLCNADMRDTFKIADFGGAAGLEVTISGSSAATVIAQFMMEANGVYVNVGDPKTVKVSDGATVSADFTTTGVCYLQVRGADITSSDFDVASATAGHFTDFTVSAKLGTLNPQEKAASVKAASGTALTFNVAEGEKYRITGLASVSSGLTESGDLYEATAATATAVAGTSGTVTYQKWVPSEIAFEADPTSAVGERKGKCTVKVLRQGGVSGRVTATVEVDKDRTDFYYDHDSKSLPRFAIDGEWGFASKDLVWEDGDGEAKQLVITLEQEAELAKYYGDGQIVLKITSVTNDLDDVTLGKSDYVLKVNDESEAEQSTVSIAATEPTATYSSTVYTRRSEGVTMTLNRSNDGDTRKNRIALNSSVSSVVFSGNGDLVEKNQYWSANDYADKTVKVSKLPKAETETTVTLKGTKSTFKAGSPKSITIVSVDDKAPAFEKDELGKFKLITYTSFSETVKFDSDYIQDGDKLSVKLIKGKLPSGIKAKVYSSGKLKFYGTPTKAGTATAYYRACVTRKGKLVKGMPLKISFKIVDPTTVDPDDKTYGQLSNTSVKSSRTLNHLPVIAGGTPQRMTGTLNVTIPKSGKVSAKYASAGGTVSFSATGWENPDFETADGTLVARMEGSKSGYALEVRALPNGRVEALVTDKNYKDVELAAHSYGKTWSSTKSGAKSWKGLYNATLIPGGTELTRGNGEPFPLSGSVAEPANEELDAPKGCGYLSFKMTSSTACASGKMTWAGLLPNGRAVSGSAYLSKGVNNWFGRSGYAYLPIFKKVSDDGVKDVLAIVAEIKSGAASGDGMRAVVGSPDLSEVLPLGRWEHTDVGDTGYGMDLHLFGSYYDPKKSLKDCCTEEKVSTTQQLLFAVPRFAGYDRMRDGRGEAEGIDPLDITVGKSKITVSTDENPNAAKITRDDETGVLSGSLKLYSNYPDDSRSYVKAAWYGVVMTGWGSECGCAEDTDPTLPFICGGFFFEDKVTYQDDGKTKTAKPLSGGGIQSISVVK